MLMVVIVVMLLVPFAGLAVLAAARESKVFLINGEAMFVENGVSEQVNGLQVDGFHVAAGFANQMAVTVFRLAQRKANLILGSGHQIHDAHLIEPLEGAIDGGHVQPRQGLLHLFEDVTGGDVAMMILGMQGLQGFQDHQSLRSRPQVFLA